MKKLTGLLIMLGAAVMLSSFTPADAADLAKTDDSALLMRVVDGKIVFNENIEWCH